MRPKDRNDLTAMRLALAHIINAMPGESPCEGIERHYLLKALTALSECLDTEQTNDSPR